MSLPIEVRLYFTLRFYEISCYWDTGTNGDFEIFSYWDTGTNVNLRDFLWQPWEKCVLQNFPLLGPMLDFYLYIYILLYIYIWHLGKIPISFIDKNASYLLFSPFYQTLSWFHQFSNSDLTWQDMGGLSSCKTLYSCFTGFTHGTSAPLCPAKQVYSDGNILTSGHPCQYQFSLFR